MCSPASCLILNDCAQPNCFTQIVSHAGRKKIVIYAKRDVEVGEELCYDCELRCPFPQPSAGFLCFLADANPASSRARARQTNFRSKRMRARRLRATVVHSDAEGT